MSGIGFGVGGSGAIGKGVMYFNWPRGGPVSSAMILEDARIGPMSQGAVGEGPS